MTRFAYSLRVSGDDIGDLVPEAPEITYGRRSTDEGFTAPILVFDMLTADGYPNHPTRDDEDFPRFGVDTDTGTPAGTETGPPTPIVHGSPVEVDAYGSSGFIDLYVDEYGGFTSRRFTGSVTAIDYSKNVIRVTATADVTYWNRRWAGSTNHTTPIPEESDIERVERYVITEAGLDIQAEGDAIDLIEVPIDTAPSRLLDLLDAICETTRGTFSVDRVGDAFYRCKVWSRPGTVPIPAAMVAVDHVQMMTERNAIITDCYVAYGYPDGTTGLKSHANYFDSDLDGKYGTYEYRTDSLCLDNGDADQVAYWLVSDATPQWIMPELPLGMHLVNDSALADILTIAEGHTVELTTLPANAPISEIEAEVIGTTETLGKDEWLLVLHLGPNPPASGG